MTVQSVVASQSYSYPAGGQNRFFVIENIVDFKTCFVGSLGTAYITSGDSCKLIKIPKSAFVTQVLVRLERKGDIGASTFTLGDSVASDSWMDTANAIGSGGTNGTVFQMLVDDNNGANSMNGYFYTADDYILMTIAGANDNSKITVAAICTMPFSKATG